MKSMKSISSLSLANRDFFLWPFWGTVFSFSSSNCMQISSSSSALSKITRAVFGVTYIDTVECSIVYPFLEKKKPTGRYKFKLQVQL